MSTELGRRERKKQQTRQLIAESARQLFAERGFEHVTLAEIARAADVSDGTLFNYFPRKEDLVFGGMLAFQGQLLNAIRQRPAGESILTAFGRFVLEPRSPRGLLGSPDPHARELLATMSRIVAGSPTLLARESQIFAETTDALAQLIAEDTGRATHDFESWVAANALMGVHRGLLLYVRREILADTDHQRIRRNLRAHAKRAIALLEHGLAQLLGPEATRSSTRP